MAPVSYYCVIICVCSAWMVSSSLRTCFEDGAGAACKSYVGSLFTCALDSSVSRPYSSFSAHFSAALSSGTASSGLRSSWAWPSPICAAVAGGVVELGLFCFFSSSSFSESPSLSAPPVVPAESFDESAPPTGTVVARASDVVQAVHLFSLSRAGESSVSSSLMGEIGLPALTLGTSPTGCSPDCNSRVARESLLFICCCSALATTLLLFTSPDFNPPSTSPPPCSPDFSSYPFPSPPLVTAGFALSGAGVGAGVIGPSAGSLFSVGGCLAASFCFSVRMLAAVTSLLRHATSLPSPAAVSRAPSFPSLPPSACSPAAVSRASRSLYTASVSKSHSSSPSTHASVHIHSCFSSDSAVGRNFGSTCRQSCTILRSAGSLMRFTASGRSPIITFRNS